MAFVNLYSELTGHVPKLSVNLAKTLVNRAWRDIRRANLWSFQLFEANWVSPSLIGTEGNNVGNPAGKCNVVQGNNQVVFDATASAILNNLVLSGPFPTPLLQRQFRVGISTIYNIWDFASNANNNIVTLTLDRPYTDTSASNTSFLILQCYYPAPYQDFLTWITIRDIVNFNDLVLNLTREEIDFRDPQRTIFYLPTHCVYYQQDQNPNSTTYGIPMFELWGQPQYQLVYQLYGLRKGTDLVNDTDTLPPSVGEDCVIALAKYYAYQWAEANKGDIPRGAGSDYRFLMEATLVEYKRLLREYRRQDRETVDNWWTVRRHHTWLSNIDGYYSAIGNIASPGAPW